MKITKEIVEKTAHLARLQFDETEGEQITKDLQKMIDWVDKLKEVDTTGVTPLTHPSEEIDQFREDEKQLSINRNDGLKNAPKHDSVYFRVPKVIK